MLRLLAASGALRVEAALLEGNENAEAAYHARNAMIAEVEAERAAAARLTSWEVIPASLSILDDAKWFEVRASGRCNAIFAALAQDADMADHVQIARLKDPRQRVKVLVRPKAPAGTPALLFHAFAVTYDGANFGITADNNTLSPEDLA